MQQTRTSKRKTSKQTYKTNKRRINNRTRRIKKSRKQYGGFLEETKRQQLIGIFERIGFTSRAITKLMNKLIHYSSYYNHIIKKKEYQIMVLYLEVIAKSEEYDLQTKKELANEFIRTKIKIWNDKYRDKADLPDTDEEGESDEETLAP